LLQLLNLDLKNSFLNEMFSQKVERTNEGIFWNH